ncbi:MAG: hypothetical protein ACRDRL_07040 [Sciscionella sp.]
MRSTTSRAAIFGMLADVFFLAARTDTQAGRGGISLVLADIAQDYLDCRGGTLYAGTTEIMEEIIGRKVTKR